MQRISQDELLATHRIYRHVETLIGPYYGHISIDRAKGYVSANRWIMFPEYHVESLREGAELPIPNVFVYFDGGEIVDNGSGLVNGHIGLTYHNVQAMLWLDEILRRGKKSELFLNILKGLGEGWNIEIQNKTQTDCPDSTPRYKVFRDFKPSWVSRDLITQGIIDSNRQLLHRGDAYPGGNPVLWDVTIFAVTKPTSVSSFDVDVQKSFDLLFKALSLR